MSTNVWSPASSNPSAIAALGGDVTGTVGANTVVKLRGRAIAATAPTDGQVYQYVAANSDWEPATSVRVVTVPVPSAQIKTMHDTPVVLVSGTAGKVTILTGFTLLYLAGATPYTIDPATLLSVYTATSLADWADVSASGFLDQAASQVLSVPSLSVTQGSLTGFSGQDIILQASTTNPTLGNGTLLVTVSYFLAATA